MSNLILSFKSARRASCPLIAISTADPAETIRNIGQAFNGGAPPIVTWDVVQGLRPFNDKGQLALQSLPGPASPDQLIGPVDALIAMAKLPENTVTFMVNAHRWINEPGVSQAIWNLRDIYKNATRRTLVLIAPSVELPIELQSDVLAIDEPLPDDNHLAQIVLDTYNSAEVGEPDDHTLSKAVDAICGLAAFPAEQVCAMSIGANGLNMEALWERKRKAVEQAKGLSIWRGNETFASIGGYTNLKEFLSNVLKGNDPPRAVVFLDEVEKSIGTGQDTSGVSQNMLGQLLTWMQDNTATGLILIGPPGTSKSMFAKATGNEGGIPTIALDLGGMKGSLVGESEQSLRNALKVCDAVSQKRSLFIATCNSIGALPPELRRRFSFGTFFVDLPTEQERASIWKIYLDEYGSTCAIPNDEGWTGAEIKTCCEIAWRLNITLKQAADYIVPISKSAGDQVNHLRQQASGRYISASHPGIYQVAKPEVQTLARRINTQEN